MKPWIHPRQISGRAGKRADFYVLIRGAQGSPHGDHARDLQVPKDDVRPKAAAETVTPPIELVLRDRELRFVVIVLLEEVVVTNRKDLQTCKSCSQTPRHRGVMSTRRCLG